jgi:hypothetical protein
MLIRITMKHFCAGLIVKNGKVIKAAPILRWTIGRNITTVKMYYVEKKKAKWEIVK